MLTSPGSEGYETQTTTPMICCNKPPYMKARIQQTHKSHQGFVIICPLQGISPWHPLEGTQSAKPYPLSLNSYDDVSQLWVQLVISTTTYRGQNKLSPPGMVIPKVSSLRYRIPRPINKLLRHHLNKPTLMIPTRKIEIWNHLGLACLIPRLPSIDKLR